MDGETIQIHKIDLSKSAFDRANAFLTHAAKPGYSVSTSRYKKTLNKH